jgi:hypothetical protein
MCRARPAVAATLSKTKLRILHFRRAKRAKKELTDVLAVSSSVTIIETDESGATA